MADWFILKQQKGMIILLEIPHSHPVETLLAGLKEVTDKAVDGKKGMVIS